MNTEQTPCPLCEQTKHMHKAKPLYGHMVCKKCYYGFANRRQMAFFLDIVGWRLIMFPFGFALGLIMASSGSSESDIQGAATLIGWLLIGLFFCKDCFAGQSPGKALCGVKVIDTTTGQSCGIAASFKRNLPLLVPFMPLIVGVQLCKGHRTGDGWSNSKVIWKKYANHPIFSPLAIPCEKPNISQSTVSSSPSTQPANSMKAVSRALDEKYAPLSPPPPRSRVVQPRVVKAPTATPAPVAFSSSSPGQSTDSLKAVAHASDRKSQAT